ncbi:hypothetical protein [uncultured Dokdonia sp.]|uniref:hypothetical protein n=1 Tax=uncultured Dokdonia sp. TaxID=575653 RepID=UPI00260AD8D9|nr:hypothetical protein [uncultured Dokdonia sp.]
MKKRSEKIKLNKLKIAKLTNTSYIYGGTGIDNGDDPLPKSRPAILCPKLPTITTNGND